jgi:hypothetical protein
VTVTKDQIAQSKKLATQLRAYMKPLVIRWIENCARAGIDMTVIRMSLSAEALILSSFAHVGDEELFVRMAKAAITRDDKDDKQQTTH